MLELCYIDQQHAIDGIWESSSPRPMGISCLMFQVNFDNCTMRNNSASEGGGGGVMAGINSTVTFSDCVISNNSGKSGGNLYANGLSKVSIAASRACGLSIQCLVMHDLDDAQARQQQACVQKGTRSLGPKGYKGAWVQQRALLLVTL